MAKTKRSPDDIGPVTLTLRFLPNTWNQATEAQRLRQALKVLLRQFGLKNEGCIGHGLPPIDPEIDPTATEPPFAPLPLPATMPNDRG